MADANGAQRNNDELFQLLTQQTEYIDQLEKENRVIVQELERFKHRLNDVVEENQTIHDAMQTQVVEKTLQQSHALVNDPNSFMDDSVGTSMSQFNSTTLNNKKAEQQQQKQHELQPQQQSENMKLKWKKELQTIEDMYASKIALLEAQLAQYANKNATALTLALNSTSNETSNVKENKEPSKTNPPNFNAPVIENLSKERDNLIKTVGDLRKTVMESQKQETTLRKNLQDSLGALENIQLEKTQVVVQKEQLEEDVAILRKKLEKEIIEGRQSITDAVAVERRRCADEMQRMESEIGGLKSSCSNSEDTIEKMRKDKVGLELRLEESRNQMLTMEKDLATLRAEMNVEIKSAFKGHNATDSHLRITQAKLQQDMLKLDQERSGFEQKVVELNRRLRYAEKHSLNLQELNVSLTQQLNNATMKHRSSETQCKSIKEKYVKHIEMLTAEYKEKNNQLTITLESTQMEYEQRLTDLEAISSKQAKLILKLREECKNIDNSLQNISDKYRTDMGRVSQENEQLRAKSDRLTGLNKELSAQCVKHGQTHRVMRQRLDELNARAHRSNVQVLNLLDQQLNQSAEKDVLTH